MNDVIEFLHIPNYIMNIFLSLTLFRLISRSLCPHAEYCFNHKKKMKFYLNYYTAHMNMCILFILLLNVQNSHMFQVAKVNRTLIKTADSAR